MKPAYLLALMGLVLFACDDDSGIKPPTQLSGFSGTITFKGAWPEDTDQIRLAAALKFPPSTIADVLLGDALPVGGDSIRYTFYTNPVALQAVGVVWKEKGQAWDATNIIGYYFPTENHLAPGTVTVTRKDEIVPNIDIECDLTKVKRAVNSAIGGMLRVQGAWPAGASKVVVAASTAPVLPSSLLDLTFSFPMDAGFDSTRYIIAVQPGTYKLVAALVIENGKSIGMESIKGAYYSFGGIKIKNAETRVLDVDLTLIFPPGSLRAAPADKPSPYTKPLK
ncbi:MAG TPA: hypothetical protein PLG50_16550 [bacterium]|nr:hypothetical protein [bacterium]HQG47271.1 hypothetical protein [bacterium]HQI50390.1 hypothetical protein [bacterium]HQJ65881.1 hypothetical protein [bacterium]